MGSHLFKTQTLDSEIHEIMEMIQIHTLSIVTAQIVQLLIFPAQ